MKCSIQFSPIHHALIGINLKYCGSVNTPYVFIDVKPQICVQSQVFTVLWKRYGSKCIISIKDLQMSCLTSTIGHQTATILSARATHFCEWSHWHNHHVQLISANISVVFEKHQTANGKRNESETKPRYIWAAQHGPFISSDRDTNKLVRTVFVGSQSWFRDTVTAQMQQYCEI